MIEYPQMPQPPVAKCGSFENKLLMEELSFDVDKLLSEHNSLICSMTDEQKYIYDVIMMHVNDGLPGTFFVNGFGGSGKTFLWNTLSAAIRSKGDIVLAG